MSTTAYVSMSRLEATRIRSVELLAAVLVAAIALRMYRLTHQSLWVDEVVTFLSSIGSVQRVVTQTEVNSNIPPLYYLVVNAFLRLGHNEAMLRLASVIFGSLSIPMLYVVVRPWFGQTTALLSAVVIAISPFHVWYSQEARPYALLLFLSLLSLWCLQQALAKPERRGWRIAFAISGAAVCYTHTVAIAFIGFAAAYVMLAVPRQQWREWGLVFGGIGLLVIPAIYRLVSLPPEAAASVGYSFSPTHILYAFWSFATGYSVGPTVADLHALDRQSIVLHYAMLIGPVLAFFGALALLGAWRIATRDKTIFRILALWFLFPMCFAVLGAVVTVHPFNVRYAILSFPPFIVLLVMGAQSLAAAPLRAGAWAILVLLSAFSLYSYFFDERYFREDNRAAGQYLEAHGSLDDLVIVNAPYVRETLQHYYSGRPSRVVRYPSDTRNVVPTATETDLGRMLAGESHFWLVLSRTYHSDPSGYIRKYCDEHFRRDLVFTRSGVEVIRYTRDRAPRTQAVRPIF